jgi:hypothetical protein
MTRSAAPPASPTLPPRDLAIESWIKQWNNVEIFVVIGSDIDYFHPKLNISEQAGQFFKEKPSLLRQA